MGLVPLRSFMNKIFYIAFIICAVFFWRATVSAQTSGPNSHEILPFAAIPLDSSQQFCNNLYYSGNRWFQTGYPENDRKGFDSLRLFIESCANLLFVDGCGKPWHAFNEITGDAQGMSSDNTRWLEYREWLKKVLYLNTTDVHYYCEDVNAMLATLNYFIPGNGPDRNGGIAIVDYLLSMNRCPYETVELLALRKATRDKQLQIWRDSVRDSIATPIDTSSKTIDEIGFSILRGPQNVIPQGKHIIHGLGDISATINPFTDATTLLTTISDAMMLRLEIFDILGRSFFIENQFFSAGDVYWKLDGKILPRGTYYVRLSTMGGEVKTVKIIHE